jgi:hypothetical protein
MSTSAGAGYLSFPPSGKAREKAAAAGPESRRHTGSGDIFDGKEEGLDTLAVELLVVAG